MNPLLVFNLGSMEIFILTVAILPFLLTIYCVIDLLKADFKEPNTKLLFLILVVLAPFVGSVIYLFLKRNYLKPPLF